MRHKGAAFGLPRGLGEGEPGGEKTAWTLGVRGEI
jgi:hypothetical protein